MVLVILGLLGVALAGTLPLAGRLAADPLQQRSLDQAEQALLGHLQGHLTLPGADTDGDGLADPGTALGWLPTATLGLPGNLRVRYQPHPALLTPPADTVGPLLPAGLDSSRLQAASASQSNLLDLCHALLQAPAADAHGHGMPVAWMLGINDPQRATAPLPLPGSTAAIGQATDLRAAGWGEVGMRMDCADRLARFHGTVQATLAAHSATRFAQFNADFRRFDIDVAHLIDAQAKAGLASAILGLATIISDQATLILLAAPGSPPDPVEIAKAIAGSAALMASLAVTAEQIKNAQADVDGAVETMADARSNHRIATEHLQRAMHHYTQLHQHTLTLDNAGGQR